MPAIQQYHSRVSPGGVSGGRRTSAEDFGGGGVSGLTAAGEGLADLAAVYEKKQARDASIWRAKTEAEMRSQWTQHLHAKSQAAPEGAAGFTDGILTEFSAYAEKTLESAPDPETRALLGVDIAQMRGTLAERAMGFETASSAKKVRRDAERTHDANRNTLRLDPSQFEKVLASTRQSVASLAIPDDAKADMLADWEQQLSFEAAAGSVLQAKSVASAKAVRDGLAKDGNPWTKRLSPENFASVMSAAERNVDAAERDALKAKADAEKTADINRSWQYADLLVRQKNGEDVSAEIEIFKARYKNDPAAALQWANLADGVGGGQKDRTEDIARAKAYAELSIEIAEGKGKKEKIAAFRDAYANVPAAYGQWRTLERELASAEKASVTEEKKVATDDERKRYLSAVTEHANLVVRQAGGEDVTKEASDLIAKYKDDPRMASRAISLARDIARETARARKDASVAQERLAVHQVSQALTGAPEARLDPSNKKDRDAVDVHFLATSKAWTDAKMPVENMQANTLAYVKQVGIIPSSLMGAIRTGLRNPEDAKTVVQTAGLVDSLLADNPVIRGQFSDATEEISLATDINDYIRAGASPEYAVKTARETRAIPSEQKAFLSAEFTKEKTKNPPADFLRKRYDDWGVDPDIPPIMAAEFSTIARAEYIKTGKRETAYESAAKIVDGTWGRSTINGSEQMMKFAPELFYNINGVPNDWMREQLESDYMEAFPSAPVLSEKKLVVTLHPTERRPDRRPVYQVLVQDDKGVFQEVKGMTWYPDFSSSKVARGASASAKAENKEAEQLRDESDKEGGL